MEKKQTAVEWFNEWLINNPYARSDQWKEALLKAKEIEEKQILTAYMTAKLKHITTFGIETVKQRLNIETQQYYDETYGSSEKPNTH